jgi:ADP-heptose:LPS heptosyltransferase
VGTKVVALFGAADPVRTGPIGSHTRIIRAKAVSCVPCGSRTCSNAVYLECMERITAEEVLAAVIELLPSRS